MISIEDRFSILEVLDQANRAADDKDVAGTQRFYAEGGRIEGDMQASGDRDAFAEALGQIYENEPGLKRHVGTGHVMREEGERVVVDSLLTVFDGEEAPGVVATAAIRDEMVRQGGDWLIDRHVVRMDPATKKAMRG